MNEKTWFTGADVDPARFLDDLKQWVEIETPTQDVARVNALVDLVEARAKASRFHVRRHAGQSGVGDLLEVSADFGASGRDMSGERVLVLAHLDTVHPVGTLNGPLKWRREGDKLFGPGVYDMKSGALMALHALELVAWQGSGGTLPVTILFTPDEENGSRSSRPVIEQAARQAKYVLVVEPARDGGKIVTARKGVAAYDIAIRGRAAHAGVNPWDGHSAIVEAARVVMALEAMNDRAREITVTIGMIHGGVGRNTVPEECHLVVDARLPSAEAARELADAIKALRKSGPPIAIDVKGGLNRPPFAQTPAAKILFGRARDLALPLGIDLCGIATGGGSDGNFTAALGIPTLDGLGADGAGAHTEREHVIVSSLAPRTALLANLMLTLD